MKHIYRQPIPETWTSPRAETWEELVRAIAHNARHSILGMRRSIARRYPELREQRWYWQDRSSFIWARAMRDEYGRGTVDNEEAAYVHMPLERVNRAYLSYVTILDLIRDQGDNVSQTMVLEAIDDILGAWLDARESREMIRHIVTGALTGDEFGPDVERELDKTRNYLRDNGVI